MPIALKILDAHEFESDSIGKAEKVNVALELMKLLLMFNDTGHMAQSRRCAGAFSKSLTCATFQRCATSERSAAMATANESEYAPPRQCGV